MGRIKRHAEEVSDRMGFGGDIDPETIQAIERILGHSILDEPSSYRMADAQPEKFQADPSGSRRKQAASFRDLDTLNNRRENDKRRHG